MTVAERVRTETFMVLVGDQRWPLKLELAQYLVGKYDCCDR
jgi:hypothetical protein